MISVEASERFRDCIRKQGLDRDRVFAAMQATAGVWGRPHEHTGAGLRRLQKGHYEARAGLYVRLIFRPERDRLIFVFAGDHEQVKRYLRGV